MSKKAFKSQASSSRAASAAFGGTGDNASAFGTSPGFGNVVSSQLSYIYEPPDLTGISDPNIGVAFKNLQKKDSNTKAKAVEELSKFFTRLGKDEPEEAILEAWVKLYPRTSIDNSRRVRQLAHSLQGQVAISYGKRLAKHMPSIVPSWLAGLQDSDKSVNRAAQVAFQNTFSTEDKVHQVWRMYQGAILEYLHDVVLQESERTLSDERTTSPDDAFSKYARVVGCAITTVIELLKEIDTKELERSRPTLTDLLNRKELWQFAGYSDPFVRRAIYRLLVVSVDKYNKALDPQILSASILVNGLHTPQIGSALDFSAALLNLSRALPTVWTDNYQGSGKKSALNRLCYYLRKGPSGGPPGFWANTTELFQCFAEKTILNGSVRSLLEDPHHGDASATELILEALREGINSKEEPRANSAVAWDAYMEVCQILISKDQADTIPKFLEGHIVPVFRNYIKPSGESVNWTVTGPHQEDVCLKALRIVSQTDKSIFQQQWISMSSKIKEDLQTSLPEQSRDYVRSQNSITDENRRWYNLQRKLLEKSDLSAIAECIKQSVPNEISTAVDVLKKRNGKPYAAAESLKSAMIAIPKIIFDDLDTKALMINFISRDFSHLILSPSAKSLIGLLDKLPGDFDLHHVLSDCMEELSKAPPSSAKEESVKGLFSLEKFAREGFLSLTQNKELEISLEGAIAKNDKASWDAIMAAVGNHAAPRDLTDEFLELLVKSLSIDNDSSTGLHGIDLVIKKRPSLIREYSMQPEGPGLMTKMLLLAGSSDIETSKEAQELIPIIENALKAPDANHTGNPLLQIIKRELGSASMDSLSVDSLVSQAQKVLDDSNSSNLSDIVEQLIPEEQEWEKAIESFSCIHPNPSIATTNIFANAVCLLVDPPHSDAGLPSVDRDGYSTLWRMIEYSTKLIRSRDIVDHMTKDKRLFIFTKIAVTIQLAGDNLSVAGSIPLWRSVGADVDSGVVDSVAVSQSLVTTWLNEDPMSQLVPSVLDQLHGAARGLSPLAYYHARAYSILISDYLELHGHTATLANETRPRIGQDLSETFSDMCLLLLSESKIALRFCNEFLADVTTLKLDQSGQLKQQDLQKFLFLNCLLYRPEEFINDIPQQRVVFFVQHIVSQLEMQMPPYILAEIFRALQIALPAIKDIYGSFWENILELLRSSWKLTAYDEHLSCIHASLRLLSTLRSEAVLQANDDLLDAWNESRKSTATSLVILLEGFRELPDTFHQPRRMIYELLQRQLPSLGADVADEENGLYPILAASSVILQQTAFEVLHQIIPSKQEQISFDKALTKDFQAVLPDELLSLILTTPETHKASEAPTEDETRSILQSYLLSWLLVFDHWNGASNLLQADYAKCLADGTYLSDLLALVTSILIGKRQKPVDPSKFDIETYTADLEPPERDEHWLLVHLFYLFLKHLPIQTKNWWRDTAPRQINIAMEAWTEKYFSKSIIASDIASVKEWAPSQTSDDHPMTIKVSLSAREITASIPVDEQAMSIAIRLPPSYPLTRAEVEGTHRVAVPEKKWASWLRNAQGQLTIAGEGGGSALIDCLLAWRKNVTAAMKGQSECAICYSVVAADRSLPTKVCKTCKHRFHGSCLFRWFSSSNSSSCPLCRNTFTYS